MSNDDSPPERKQILSSPTCCKKKNLTSPTEKPHPQKSKWSDLPKRLATVTIGAPLIVGILSNATTCQLFFQIVHILCCFEWIHLCPKYRNRNGDDDSDVKEDTKRTYTFTSLFPLFSFLVVNAPSEMIMLVLSLLSATIYIVGTINLMDDPKNGDKDSKHMAFGLIYLGLSFHCWIKVCQQSLSHTLFLLFVVWNSDSGALVAGRLFGKKTSPSHQPSWFHKISPAKSKAGFAGGIAFGIITALTWPKLMFYVYHQISHNTIISSDSFNTMKTFMIDESESNFTGYGQTILDAVLHLLSFTFKETTDESTFYDLYQIKPSNDNINNSEMILSYHSTYLLGCFNNIICRRLLLGFVLSVAAIAGDLVESAVKRNSGKKDSGKLLPGHGGILDRFDSSFIAITIYYHWCVRT